MRENALYSQSSPFLCNIKNWIRSIISTFFLFCKTDVSITFYFGEFLLRNLRYASKLLVSTLFGFVWVCLGLFGSVWILFYFISVNFFCGLNDMHPSCLHLLCWIIECLCRITLERVPNSSREMMDMYIEFEYMISQQQQQ